MRLQIKTIIFFAICALIAVIILRLTYNKAKSRVFAHTGKNERNSVAAASQTVYPLKFDESPNNAGTIRTNYQNAVLNHVDENGIIFLASLDSSHVDMAINLYLTSFLHLNISNFLFIGSDDNACASLSSYNKDIHCFTYFNETSGKVTSDYGSPSFNRKSFYKTKMILDALRAGVTVVIVDLDIVFFRNPLPYLNCADCDIQIQDDTHVGNTGFYMARPTPPSMKLHNEALILGLEDNKLCDQDVINRILKSMSSKGLIKSNTLSQQLFPCGKVYFEYKRLMSFTDGKCDSCVLVHNNWIASKEAKIYRFKEHGLWQVDVDGYYSDSNRKYLAYDNPIDFGAEWTLKYEREALKAALYIGHLLNRTVILPKFHCYGCTSGACQNNGNLCSLGAVCKISSLDASFGGSYREHVFLDHPKVPQVVKQGQSGTFLIKSDVIRPFDIKINVDDIGEVLTPTNSSRGATPLEINEWFGKKYAEVVVLRFHNLYGAADINSDAAFAKGFSKTNPNPNPNTLTLTLTLTITLTLIDKEPKLI